MLVLACVFRSEEGVFDENPVLKVKVRVTLPVKVIVEPLNIYRIDESEVSFLLMNVISPCAIDGFIGIVNLSPWSDTIPVAMLRKQISKVKAALGNRMCRATNQGVPHPNVANIGTLAPDLLYQS
jgi:hypothetical protein